MINYFTYICLNHLKDGVLEAKKDGELAFMCCLLRTHSFLPWIPLFIDNYIKKELFKDRVDTAYEDITWHTGGSWYPSRDYESRLKNIEITSNRLKKQTSILDICCYLIMLIMAWAVIYGLITNGNNL